MLVRLSGLVNIRFEDGLVSLGLKATWSYLGDRVAYQGQDCYKVTVNQNKYQKVVRQY